MIKFDINSIEKGNIEKEITLKFNLTSNINYVQGKGSESKSYFTEKLIKQPIKQLQLDDCFLSIYSVRVLSDFVKILNDKIYQINDNNKILVIIDEDIVTTSKSNYIDNFKIISEFIQNNRNIYFLQFTREKTNLSVQQEYICQIKEVKNSLKKYNIFNRIC